jgi:hypothetical protein
VQLQQVRNTLRIAPGLQCCAIVCTHRTCLMHAVYLQE